MRAFIIFGYFIATIAVCHGKDIIVTVRQGALNGTIKYDRKGDAFYSFQSIPYAKPPVAELRFKDPLPADSWTGVLDATQDLPFCYQSDIHGDITGQEDCLYLNVYTPELPSTSTTTLKPVMVFIHGGSFTEGSGRQDLYSPEYLIPEDVVLVTINYRLGIFGFFALDDHTMGTPGNAGLKDQVMALKWVQNNIDKFGGNPESVTIFGESAGGSSVHLLVLSPLAKGLFHRAVFQSGSAIHSWVDGTPNNGELLATALRIPTENTSEMLDALRQLTSFQIFFGQISAMFLNSTTGPIVEKQTDGTAFLTDTPLTLIEKGNYHNVPMMLGYNDAEGIAMDQAIRAIAGQSMPITDFSLLIPTDLDITNGTTAAEELTIAIKEFYYGDSEPSTDDMKPFIQIYTDIVFSYPAYKAAIAHVKTAEKPIFFYRFSADTLLNVYKRRDETSATYAGASHCDELGYLFHTNLTPNIEKGSVEDLAIDRVVKLWTNFAKYDHPTPTDFTEFQWLPLTESTFNYVDIGTTTTVPGVDPDAENIKFWNDIYEKYGSSSAKAYISPLIITIYIGLAVLFEVRY